MKLRSSAGFSLMEIMIAITLIAVIMGTVGSSLFQRLEEGKINSVKIQMKNFKTLLGEFRRHCHRYPTTDEGLQALIEKPTGGKDCKRYPPSGYIEGGEIPLDPWDSEYIYTAQNFKEYTIISIGPDGEEGTEDDISSHDK